MKNFKDIEQPKDKTKKTVRLIAPVIVPKDLDPFVVMDLFIDFCKENGWLCEGGGVQFPDESL